MGNVKQVSSKQAAKLRAYKRAKKEIEQELKESGKWVCIFTGQPIPDYVTWDQIGWHHLKGRDGELICDKKFIRPYMSNHTGENSYNDTPRSELRQQWWWDGFLNRIKEIDYDLWRSMEE